MIVFLTLTSAVLLLSYNSNVQTYAAHRAAAWLSSELKTKFSIGKLKVVGFHDVEIDSILLEDREKDTILSASQLIVDLKSYKKLDLKHNSMEVDTVTLRDGQIFLHKNDKGVSNLKFIIDYFSGGKKSKPDTSSFRLSVKNVNISNFRFRMENEVHEDVLKPGILNVNDLDIMHINLRATDFYNQDDSVVATIKHLSFTEKCGFKVNSLQAKATIGSKEMVFQHLLIKTPYSRVADHFEMHFKDIDSFDNFEDAVYMRAHLQNTHLSSKDIAFFSSYLKNTDLEAEISGSAKGRLNNLRVKGFDLTSSDHTVIKGDLNLKGLPDLESTYMDLHLEEFQTSSDDVKSILRKVGFPRSIDDIPKELNPLGIVRYKGTFNGFYNDFVANGTFNTALGTVVSDLNLKLKGRLPIYRGLVQTRDFDLGKILNEPGLGKVSFTSEINGEGFNKLANRDTIASQIQYVDYQGYRYRNINVKGSRFEKLFNGKITIDDQNLGLSFNGAIDLNKKSPAYKFKADILHADLRKLGFMKDSITIKTHLDIDAEGTTLDDLQGLFLMSNTTITRNQISKKIDSVSLVAQKSGEIRSLSLSSCLLDASVKGNYDLETFPSAVKKIFAHYIPSASWGKIVYSRSQNFEFNFNIYDAEPLLSLFAPTVSLSGTATAQGKFNAITGKFSTSGLVHELDLGDVELNSISFEGENEDNDAINLNISIDSVRLNEKILAQNINISNAIQHDSLMFNLKVSDVSAVNHLDLNGQIAFHDQFTSLGILPSELILDNQTWQIANSFKIRFEKDVTRIMGFNIKRNNESLIIDGPLSSNQADTVKATFKDFNISAVNQILKQYNVQLEGNLNGNAFLSGILDKLSFRSDLSIDSLGINKVEVGNMHVVNKWNGEEKTIDFDGTIHHENIDVMKLKGNLGLSKKNSSINAILKLNKAQAVILQPVVGDLLSDLKGTLTSDLKVSGERSDPIVNGTIKLENTEFTINYLKTHYKINDQVNFEDGYIDIKKLELTDPFYNPARKNQHIAYLTGEIDLTHISKPYFDATIHALNFLCLRTTEKDNDEYYGTAFGTGDFTFTGPIETMNIDIKATTNKSTVFNVPLNRPSTVGQRDYITFVRQPDSIKIARKQKNLHNGVTLNFDLNITTDATAKLIFDKNIGDVIRGAGTSDMNLQITPQGDFLMYGTFEIDHGDYLFTSQNVLNKLFTVDRGGSIRFTGDPMTAQLNLQADYQARTSVKNLYDAANVQPTNASALDQSVLVDCKINLEGDLSNPTFDFDLLFPNDPNIEYDLQTYLRSNEVVTTQSMLFLASNQFNGKLTPSNGIAIATSTGVQFLSNQLSNLLNNFSTRVDLNFRSLSDVGLNYRFLNDRMVFTGNIASTDTASNIGYNPLALTNSKKLTGNVEVAYTINKTRNLTLRAYDKPIPQDILPSNYPTTLYSPGLGIVYQKDFSSLKSIFKRQKVGPTLLPSDTSRIFNHKRTGADSLQKANDTTLKQKENEPEKKPSLVNHPKPAAGKRSDTLIQIKAVPLTQVSTTGEIQANTIIENSDATKDTDSTKGYIQIMRRKEEGGEEN